MDFQLGLQFEPGSVAEGSLNKQFAQTPALVFWMDSHVMDIETAVVMSEPDSADGLLIRIEKDQPASVPESLFHGSQVIPPGGISHSGEVPEFFCLGKWSGSDFAKGEQIIQIPP